MSKVVNQIGDVSRDQIQEQFRNLRDAVEEGESNALRLFDGSNDDLTRGYLEGDAYEIEQQAGKLAQNLRHLAFQAADDLVGGEDAAD